MAKYGSPPTTLNHNSRVYRVKHLPEADMHIGLDEQVCALVEAGNPLTDLLQMLPAAAPSSAESDSHLIVGNDGVYVQLGPSWRDERMHLSPEERHK
jgi:hypothetical protein